jgi:hypothetical protein
MPKNTIFTIETNDPVINMEVNQSLYKACQVISPLYKKKNHARFNDIKNY